MEYADVMGQLVNPGKCFLLFGKSCPPEVREEVKEILQVTHESFEPKYLGLPTPEGRMHKGNFQNLPSNLANCMLLCGGSHLAQSGKEVLIKAVAQALPTYVMGVFKLPLRLCKDLTKFIMNFWWGAKNDKRKTYWVAWDRMLTPKTCGGLGFRDMRLFN